ncbi:MAG: GLPGLI family protein [Saprospiraceae bacterium]
MKKIAFLLFSVSTVFCAIAQTTSGSIVYAHSEKIDPSRMKIVTITGGGGGDEPAPAMPTTIDDERTLVFGGGFAKFKGGRGSGMMRMNIESHGGAKKENKEEIKMKAPFESRTFFNMNKGSKIQLLTLRDEEKGTEEAVFQEISFITPENIEYSEKTKDIAGFKCKKATIKDKDGKVTLWYTLDIPYTFSPVEKYTPKEGFVLELEADDVSYKATKYENTPVKPEELIMPGGAKKVTKEEYDAKRKEAMEKFRPFRNN